MIKNITGGESQEKGPGERDSVQQNISLFDLSASMGNNIME